MSARTFQPFGDYSGCGPLPPQVVEALPHAEEVSQALARTVFASQWGDAIERATTARNYPEREESERDAAPEGFELPNLSGCDLCDVAPHDKAPARFGAYARHVVAHVVARAWLEHDGAAILERWHDMDAAELGHTLALDALGTGAAEWETDSDSELVPTWDCDGRLYLSLGEVWEPDEPTDADLRRLAPRALNLLDPRDVRNAEPSDDARAELVAAIRAAMDEQSPTDALETVSDLLRAHGVERITLPDDDETTLRYVNTGDTYSDTLTHDGTRFRVQSWGAALEHAEERRTFETGESACPACSAYVVTRNGIPCSECGNVN